MSETEALASLSRACNSDPVAADARACAELAALRLHGWEVRMLITDDGVRVELSKPLPNTDVLQVPRSGEQPRIEVVDGISVEVYSDEIRYEAGAEVDADGAPNSYTLPSSGLRGLDAIGNAMRDPSEAEALVRAGTPPAHGWAGVVVDQYGQPVVQQDGEHVGFLVSPTALQDRTHAPTDPRRYVDATRIAYVSVPPAILDLGAQLGDGCLVADRDTGRSAQALIADIGPRRKLGEISVACAEAIGIPSSPRNGGSGCGVIVRIFLQSAASPPWRSARTQADVAALVDARVSLT